MNENKNFVAKEHEIIIKWHYSYDGTIARIQILSDDVTVEWNDDELAFRPIKNEEQHRRLQRIEDYAFRTCLKIQGTARNLVYEFENLKFLLKVLRGEI